jgi:hypothetical protein
MATRTLKSPPPKQKITILVSPEHEAYLTSLSRSFNVAVADLAGILMAATIDAIRRNRDAPDITPPEPSDDDDKTSNQQSDIRPETGSHEALYACGYEAQPTGTCGMWTGPTSSLREMLAETPDEISRHSAVIVRCNPDGSNTVLYRWSNRGTWERETGK